MHISLTLLDTGTKSGRKSERLKSILMMASPRLVRKPSFWDPNNNPKYDWSRKRDDGEIKKEIETG
jgi:hypothetical protein